MSTIRKLDASVAYDKTMRKALIDSLRHDMGNMPTRARLRARILADGLEKIHRDPRLTGAAKGKLFRQFAKEYATLDAVNAKPIAGSQSDGKVEP